MTVSTLLDVELHLVTFGLPIPILCGQVRNAWVFKKPRLNKESPWIHMLEWKPRRSIGRKSRGRKQSRTKRIRLSSNIDETQL
ncbi:hypothetical protein F2Q70_00024206 [Brassica cretica]|uniref:Uncharacterized protein n=1 Tax=Brassica cretica TaxID=69181 RepID=A0A8S9L6R1_BRACR|nr:hypothetical protein F2Q70_00024206 [Brassica cretica]